VLISLSFADHKNPTYKNFIPKTGRLQMRTKVRVVGEEWQVKNEG
jgi:hypothetical protein